MVNTVIPETSKKLDMLVPLPDQSDEQSEANRLDVARILACEDGQWKNVEILEHDNQLKALRTQIRPSTKR